MIDAEEHDMAATPISARSRPAEELERMHLAYRSGGAERHMAPHIVYAEPACPHGCGRRLQAIGFRLEAYGPAVHDPLVRAWWNDTGFAGRCPQCGGWIHFTIGGKKAITPEQADQLLKMPDDWHVGAVIL